MTAQQPGVGTDVDAMWSPALARGLIRDDVLRSMRYCNGYTDLLGPSVDARPSWARRAMRSPIVAAIYELLWRPIMVVVMSLHGIAISAERERVAAAVHLGGGQRVLEVSCGPGAFTSFFAGQLSGDGFVIGLDNSVPMIQRAVRGNDCARAVYMRGDPLSLPFNNHAFDVVCCLAALHMMPEPIRVLHEMVRVLAPGGRIAVMTSCGREPFLVLQTFFAAAGLIDVEQQRHGISQFVIARRPEDPRCSRSSPALSRRPAS